MNKTTQISITPRTFCLEQKAKEEYNKSFDSILMRFLTCGQS